jgi:hypothetical protein
MDAVADKSPLLNNLADRENYQGSREPIIYQGILALDFFTRAGSSPIRQTLAGMMMRDEVSSFTNWWVGLNWVRAALFLVACYVTSTVHTPDGREQHLTNVILV